MLPTAKESTVQPSNSFVMSKFNVKQTKAQVFESSSNYSIIKPKESDKMLEEYMSKLNKVTVANNNSNKKQPQQLTPKKSESSDNILTNEFMRVREEKFGKNVEKENVKNNVKSQHKVRISTASNNCKIFSFFLQYSFCVILPLAKTRLETLPQKRQD